MKTKVQNPQAKQDSSELQSRSEQLSRNTNTQPASRKTFTEAMAEVDREKRTAPIPHSELPTPNSQVPTPPSTGSLSATGGEGQGEVAPTPHSALRTPKSARPYVNFEERERNRQLPVDRVLAVLKRWVPKQYDLAEVVGQWVWITFPEQPVERVRADLSQLGFHWNNTRQCWQHPCGQTLPRGQQDPHEKYASYFPGSSRRSEAKADASPATA